MKLQSSHYHRDQFDYFVDITTRWNDNDIYGHVNNVTYYSFFDSAANHFLIYRGGLDIHSAPVIGLVVASECQYKQAVAYPEPLEVGFRANRIGHSSVEYGLAVFRPEENVSVAFGTFTHVFVERESGQSIAIPQSIRTALETVCWMP